MSVLIVSVTSMADLMSGDPNREYRTDIVGAILSNRKILTNRDDDQRMLEGALQGLDEYAGKKLVGDELFKEIYSFVGRMPHGVRIVEDEEAREILSKAGITYV